MQIPSISAAITYGLALSGLALSVPTKIVTERGFKTLDPRTDWMLKCSHGSCYSIVACDVYGAVTHNNPSCWQMCSCVATNGTVTPPVRH
ncbi:hypothetical protein KVR01_007526 [Diaporthe batatas]|uniref:uncharacterized protein n=1 Tax=Diaporthe batatas TaxID=748121 RepID=UPI001D056976|nr:uncharacterized protein KVR01_007526 [Diaporthe batatas]KAG8163048.1 hypothetical protein KVR01_007526 [Diaporthe batatas]